MCLKVYTAHGNWYCMINWGICNFVQQKICVTKFGSLLYSVNALT